MNIARRIKEQRTKIGLTQSELAKEIGITLDMVKSLEVGRVNPSVETLSKLSDLFGCSADYLLGKDSFAVPEVARIIREVVDKFGLDLDDPVKREQLRQIIIKAIEQTNKDLK